MISSRTRHAAVLSLVIAASSTGGLPAAGAQEDLQDTVTINYPDELPLAALVEYVSQTLDLKILYGDELQGKKIILRPPSITLPRARLLDLLSSALRVEDLAIVEDDLQGFYRIVEFAQMQRVATDVRDGDAREGLHLPGRVVTQVIRVPSGDTKTMAAHLKSFMSWPQAASIEVAEQGLLIVTDYEAVVARLLKLVELLDTGRQHVSVHLLPVQHADAAHLASQLHTILQEGYGAGPGRLGEAQILADMVPGKLLVTGPTGSGKSTTLYAAMQELDHTELNIVTLEDPIEYQLEGVSQTQVSDKKGMTFASGLRTVLRQDPDVIVVGEIRDEDTARMAIQSSQTGHLVLSTMHTNDAASAVTRLLNLGVEPYLVAGSLLGVMAQRLVRRVCPDCKVLRPLTDDEHRRLYPASSEAPEQVAQGRGCERCLQTGYYERIGIFELLEADANIADLIIQGAPAREIKQAGVDAHTLRREALYKLEALQVSPREVLRVTHSEPTAALRGRV